MLVKKVLVLLETILSFALDVLRITRFFLLRDDILKMIHSSASSQKVQARGSFNKQTELCGGLWHRWGR